MTKLSIPGLVGMFAASLSGCLVLANTSHYRPKAPTGEVVRALEPRTQSVIVFEVDGVLVAVKTSFLGDGGLQAAISFEVPADSTAQLLQHHIEVFTAGGSGTTRELTGHVWTGPGRTRPFPVTAPMVGGENEWTLGKARGYAGTKHAAFFFTASLFESSPPEAFTLRAPGFSVNGKGAKLPSVELSLESERLWTSVP